MTREEQRAKAAHEYIQSDSVAAGNEVLAFGDFINGAKWADSHPHWIPVEERLPEKEEADPNVSVDVIVTDGKSCYTSHYNFSLKMWRWHENITHWMPIVPPRKEEVNE